VTYNGIPSLPVHAGSYPVSATVVQPSYTGSATGTLTIAPAPQSINFAALAPVHRGDPAFALTGSASSGLALSYGSSDPSVATVSGGMVTIVGVGTTTITASQAGNADVLPATPVPQTLTVDPTAATVSLGNLSQTYTGAPLAATVVTNPLGLAVSVTYNGSTSAPVHAGSYAVIATVTDPGFSGSQSGTLSINQAGQTISFAALAPATVGAAPRTMTATASSGLAVSYASSNPAVATVSGNVATIVGAGTTNITASQNGNGDFLAATPVVQPLVVNAPASVPSLPSRGALIALAGLLAVAGALALARGRARAR